MKRLTNKQWKNIFRNLQEDTEDNVYGENWVQAVYLDPVSETDPKWGLVYGEELFEDGFKTEDEANERLKYLEKSILG